MSKQGIVVAAPYHDVEIGSAIIVQDGDKFVKGTIESSLALHVMQYSIRTANILERGLLFRYPDQIFIPLITDAERKPTTYYQIHEDHWDEALLVLNNGGYPVVYTLGTIAVWKRNTTNYTATEADIDNEIRAYITQRFHDAFFHSIGYDQLTHKDNHLTAKRSDDDGKRFINLNLDCNCCSIMEDYGKRTAFNGVVPKPEDLQYILKLIK